MKSKTFLLLVFLLLLPSISSAAYKYIKITTTNQPNDLWFIKGKLNNAGFNMILRQVKNKYIVYSGPFITEQSSTQALKKIHTMFPNAKIIGKKEQKNETYEEMKVIEAADTNESSQIEIVEEEIVVEDYDGFFFGASMGLGYMPYTHTTTSGVVIFNKPTESSMVYAFEVGYRFQNSNIFTSTKYLNSSSNDIKMDCILLSLNYIADYSESLKPYIGILGGYSKLKRDYVILNNTTTTDTYSTSAIGGIEFGVIFNLESSLKPYLSYKYLKMDNTAQLVTSTGTSELKHDSVHSIELGFRF